MAEWPSRDFFDRAVTPARDGCGKTHARFGPIKAAFADSADHVENHTENEQDSETQPKDKFRSNQLTNKVRLKNSESAYSDKNAIAKFRVLFDFRN
jgi:hypothetical protein